MLDYTVRPLGALDWTGARTPDGARRSRATFRATWTDTLDLLERELYQLAAHDVIMQLAVTERDIRIDGGLRANARPAWPGVRVLFDSRHGPLTYQTDTCELWQHNVRSIALGLEALRAVDRYGITSSGEQYRGWKQLTTGTMTVHEAEAVLRRWHGAGAGEMTPYAVLYRKARAAAHPDRHGGDHTAWWEVEAAARVLGLLDGGAR